MRFSMTAKALVRQRSEALPMHELTAVNIRKVTRFRENGEDELEAEVARLEDAKKREERTERDQHEKDGSLFEWVPRPNGKHGGGPGRMNKKRVYKPEW